MSYKIMVKVRGETEPVGNELYFGNKKEAEDYASDLCGRWTMAEKCDVVRARKRANYQFRDGKLQKIEG
jgi:hypothetical protein